MAQQQIYSLFGLKSPAQVQQERLNQYQTSLQGLSGAGRAGAGLGALLGGLFSGKSEEMKQAEQIQQLQQDAAQSLSARDQVRAQMGEGPVAATTPEAQILQDLTNRSDYFDTLAARLESAGLVDQANLAKNEATRKRLEALQLQRELAPPVVSELDQLRAEELRQKIENMKNPQDMTFKERAALAIDFTPESVAASTKANDVSLLVPRVDTASSKLPTAVQTFEYYQKLTPEERGLFNEALGQSGVTYRDTGGAIGVFNKRTGQIIGEIPKTLPPAQQPDVIKQAEKAKVTGKTQAERQLAAPDNISTINNLITTLDQLVQHPGFAAAVGKSSMLPTIPGGQTADFETLLDKVKGGSFVQAFESLRGGGAITEKEGEKATVSVNALKVGMSEPGFLTEVEQVKKLLQEKLRKEVDLLENGLKEPATQTTTQPSVRRRWDPVTRSFVQ